MPSKSTPLTYKTCACCGGEALGQQWHNRDLGYGVCRTCVARFRERGTMSEAEIRDLYGVEGVNFEAGS